MRRIDSIILHCSGSCFGNAVLIDRWHREKGWRGIGYHYVILNSYPDEESYRLKRPQFWRDGATQIGRRIEMTGAHARGHNAHSIGICLIGHGQFTHQQFRALALLFEQLKKDYPEIRLLGHYEVLRPGDPPKTCPDLDMDWVRSVMTKQL